MARPRLLVLVLLAAGLLAALGVAAGARRIAVVRAICDAPDPERAARALRAALP